MTVTIEFGDKKSQIQWAIQYYRYWYCYNDILDGLNYLKNNYKQYLPDQYKEWDVYIGYNPDEDNYYIRPYKGVTTAPTTYVTLPEYRGKYDEIPEDATLIYDEERDTIAIYDEENNRLIEFNCDTHEYEYHPIPPPPPPPPPECSEGSFKCVEYDLYQCVNGMWQLIEPSSEQCGYTPPTPPTISRTQILSSTLCISGILLLLYTVYKRK